MACETKVETIGGKKWTCTQFPASEALEIETILAPVVLQAIVPAVEAIRASSPSGESLSKMEIRPEVLSEAVAAIFSALPPAKMIDLMKRLCAGPHLFVDGESVDFEKVYSGGKGVALRYKVAAFVLRWNFSDFLGEMIPVVAKSAATGSSKGTSA